MSKSGVIILIIAALVFTGLGFVIGQVVVAAGSYPGTKDDPAVSESYVNDTVTKYVTDLQDQIDDLKAQLEAVTGSGTVTPGTTTPSEGGSTTPGGTATTNKHVKVTGDGINVRDAAVTGNVLTTVSQGTVLIYLEASSVSGVTWYKVQLSDGTVGFISGDYCSAPY